MLTAIPALVRAVRARDTTALLATSYCAVYFAALMVFRFHSEQYLCWFIPSLILIAGLYSPLNGRLMLAAVAIAFIVKLAVQLPFQSGSTIAAAPALARYCDDHRPTTLYVLGVDDEFLSAALPLRRVRYGWIDPGGVVAREHPHLAYLGILISAGQAPADYRERLRAWGLDSDRPIGTGIASPDLDGLRQIIQTHPEADFLVSKSIVPEPEKLSTHNIRASGPDFTLLESKSMLSTDGIPAWTCKM